MKPGEGIGYVRVLAQRKRHPALVQAANDLLEGRSPADTMRDYVARERDARLFNRQ